MRFAPRLRHAVSWQGYTILLSLYYSLNESLTRVRGHHRHLEISTPIAGTCIVLKDPVYDEQCLIS